MQERKSWTREQLNEMLPKMREELNQELEKIEEEYNGEINGIPPLTTTEAIDYILRILDIASERPLTQKECFMHGQLLCVFKQAIQAETLGYKKAGGRYFVVSDEDINKLMSGK